MEGIVLESFLPEKKEKLRAELLRLKGEENVGIWDSLSEFVHQDPPGV
jgi:hypothetical protein